MLGVGSVVSSLINGKWQLVGSLLTIVSGANRSEMAKFVPIVSYNQVKYLKEQHSELASR